MNHFAWANRRSVRVFPTCKCSTRSWSKKPGGEANLIRCMPSISWRHPITERMERGSDPQELSPTVGVHNLTQQCDFLYTFQRKTSRFLYDVTYAAVPFRHESWAQCKRYTSYCTLHDETKAEAFFEDLGR